MASSLPSAQAVDEAARLQALDVDVQNQGDLERDLAEKADKLIAEKAEENETKRLEKVAREKDRVCSQIRENERRLRQPMSAPAQQRLQLEVERLISHRDKLSEDVRDIQKRIDGQREIQQTALSSGFGRQQNETRRDYLLRTGKITPFDIINEDGTTGPEAALQNALIGAEDEQRENEQREQDRHNASHRNLTRPGLDFDNISDSSDEKSSRKRQKLDPSVSAIPTPQTSETTPAQQTAPETSAADSPHSSASYVASERDGGSSEDDEYMPETKPEKKTAAKRKRGKGSKAKKDVEEEDDLAGVDDGDESVYRERLEMWTRTRSAARRREQPDYEDDPNQPEWCKPHPKHQDIELPNGLKVPGDIAHHLFPYQKTGVQWLWELHQQTVGGIVGDEMGLGKTVQAITYLAALHHSGMYSKPAIVVCPATLMVQWVSEFHNWWPSLRVSILHSSGSGMFDVKKEQADEEKLARKKSSTSSSRYVTPGQKAAKKILKRVVEEGHVLVTTYSGLQSYSDLLVGVEWGAAILDEGHKIRNPDAAITLSCKELRTPHRIILSGTPIQNSLIDLWSLFDFVFPMRLGTLVTFKNQFEIPIRQGGYASASNLQVQTAARCAETLRDAIKPYLLQRFKNDVASDLPKKSEQVIFCKLTAYQRDLYNRYLSSEDVKSIYKGKKKSFAGIDMLRKICNHPDLTDLKYHSHEDDYGNSSRSGKMKVLQSLLELWRDTGHKTLLFAQTVQTLDILEKLLVTLGGFTFCRMDGSTQIPKRQAIVTEFNTNPDLNVFLLTTRVGGIGINLTGADRVIIYDPDWNPSTDAQACERSWRLGQKRDVTIFRLMTKGTIEEKIYHRQIFKQFMTNKITKDPQQREGFHLSDLYDLFTLTDENDHELETTKVFKNAEVSYQEEKPDIQPTNFSLRRNGGRVNEPRSNADSPRPSDQAATPTNVGSDELSHVPGIATVEDLVVGDQSEAENALTPQGAEADENANNEDRLMKSLFAKSGVHAALEHTQIINGKKVVKSEAQMIDAEARRVANQAAAGLRRAEAAARSVPIGIPTWTGQFGMGGRPSGSSAQSGRGGPSSSSLIAGLNPSAATNTQAASNVNITHMPRGREFIPLITRFLRSRRGPVASAVIIDEFRHYCMNEQRASEFYEMIREVAELTRDNRGVGLWSLKPRNAAPRAATRPAPRPRAQRRQA